jgi:sensor c-di-GMP phosphodiesterase-like protein
MHHRAGQLHPLSKPQAIALTLVLAAIAIGVPILFALHQAQLQGLDAAKNRAMLYAQNVIQRSDKTGDQITQGIDRLLKASPSSPCDSDAIAVMREIDLNSSYIQAIGHVKDNRLECSSLGISDLPLGAPDLINANGTSIRYDVQFAFAPKDRFIVIERDHYAAIIHKDLPLDISLSDKDVSLAIFSTQSRHMFTAKGFVSPDWIERLGDRKDIAFVDQGHVVALVHSQTYLTAALATVPVTFANSQIKDMALLLVPIGLVSGLLMTFAILHLAKLQLSMASVMKTALRRREFFLLYQPIVDLRTGHFIGAEALIRWRRPLGETISPDLFIPIAEKAGMIRLVTRYVLERISEDAQGLFKKYPHFHIAINLSYEDMQSKETAQWLADLKHKLDAAPHNIIVEATERGLINATRAKEIIHEIHSCGINIAIDDFGTGYSSLSYLQTLDLDLLKIDKSFVDTIGTEAVTGQVIDHIIDMSKDLNFEMIAEGVETRAQADFLRGKGVQYAQGWLFGKAMPLPDLIRQLDAPA